VKPLAFAFLLLLTSVVVVSSARAQEGGPTPSPDEVNAIAENLYCPVCENVPLDVCGTAACAQWRQQIADLLTAGYNEQQIYDYFARYGGGVLAIPPASGFNWLFYIVPPLGLSIAALILWRNFRSWTRQPVTKSSPESKSHKSKYSQRLEDELKTRR
jgi:cytochrome c-type biogenesis protein CcmH